MFSELVKNTRSIRRFYHDKKVDLSTLKELIDIVRLCPSGANKQPLKYIVVNHEETCDEIFTTLGWAGYLKDWDGPVKEEQPTAYIVMLRDKDIMKALSFDDGIAAQTILLAATEKGLGGCFIGNMKRSELTQILGIEEKYDISLLIALGYPKELVQLYDVNSEDSIEYWRDGNQIHHVPKRKLDDVLIQIID